MFGVDEAGDAVCVVGRQRVVEVDRGHAVLAWRRSARRSLVTAFSDDIVALSMSAALAVLTVGAVVPSAVRS